MGEKVSITADNYRAQTLCLSPGMATSILRHYDSLLRKGDTIRLQSRLKAISEPRRVLMLEGKELTLATPPN
jgi:hypothetical protein